MADARIKINFNNSMTLEKRDPNFAYLRQGIMKNRALALYPENSFSLRKEYDNADYEFQGMAGSSMQEPIVVLYDDDRKKLLFRTAGGGNIGDPAEIDGDGAIVAYGEDGLYIADGYKKKIYAVNYGTVGGEVGEFSRTPQIQKGLYDGLYYWWVGGDIWRQSPGKDAVEMMDTGLSTSSYLTSLCDYDDRLVIFANKTRAPSSFNRYMDLGIVLIWDKSNTTFFDHRITFENKLVIGGGVVDGELILVTFEKKGLNIKESSGVMAVHKWNGFRFNWLNEIEVDEYTIDEYNRNTVAVHSDGNNLYVALNRNTKTDIKEDLYQPYLYRISSLGEIEVMTNTKNVAKKRVMGIYHGEGGIYYATGNNPIRILRNTDKTSDYQYQSYRTFSGSTYITNFYCNPYNYHRLQGLSLSFEKLFNLEELDVYYRDSDRKDWTKLVTIDKAEVIKGANKQNSSLSDEIQRYQITLMPNGSSLPEFHEIQFKFVSKQGFSVIGAWFEYDYITRHNIK